MSVLNIATTSWITSACEGMNISQKMCLLSWVAREVPVYGPGRERSKPPVLGDEGTTNSSQRFYVDILVVQFLRIHLTYEHWKKNHESGRASSVGWYEAHLFGPDIEVTWGGMDAYPPPRIVPKTSDKHGGFLQDDCQGTTSLKMEKHSIVIQLSYMFTNKYMYIYIPGIIHVWYIYTYMNFVDFYGWLMLR